MDEATARQSTCEGEAQMQIMKMAVSLAMILMPTLSFAEWEIEAQGAKVMSLPADRLGILRSYPPKLQVTASRPICKSNASNPPSLREGISP
jgi:hypothetical protein